MQIPNTSNILLRADQSAHNSEGSILYTLLYFIHAFVEIFGNFKGQFRGHIWPWSQWKYVKNIQGYQTFVKWFILILGLMLGFWHMFPFIEISNFNFIHFKTKLEAGKMVEKLIDILTTTASSLDVDRRRYCNFLSLLPPGNEEKISRGQI